ncbi:MAG: hypothetical protein HYX51_10965 [Chloroflexi bacterium]|nr:hypothetical protein [Chloroflexota bacterium]
MAATNHRRARGGEQAPGVIVSALSGKARVAGAGLEVFELIKTYQALSGDFAAFRLAYHWLTEAQLKAALAWYESHKQEVEERLERERTRSLEEHWEKYPETRPPIR